MDIRLESRSEAGYLRATLRWRIHPWMYQMMRFASILVNILCSHIVGDSGIPSSCNERLLKRVFFMGRIVCLAVIKRWAREKKKKKEFIQRCTSIGAGLEVRKKNWGFTQYRPKSCLAGITSYTQQAKGIASLREQNKMEHPAVGLAFSSSSRQMMALHIHTEALQDHPHGAQSKP